MVVQRHHRRGLVAAWCALRSMWTLLTGRITGESFDAVIASEVIEHVEKPDAFVRVLAQLTRPGGAIVMSTISRTAESLLLAKVAAEYILGMVPPGTHDWNRFVTPGGCCRWLMQCTARRHTEELVLMCKALEHDGLSVVLQEMAGMAFNPLDRTWTLESTTSVNYIACFKRM